MTTESIYRSPAGERAVLALYDAVLAHWPVAHETVTLPTRHGDTFVIASGDPLAPPLILLHGSASNAAAWVGEVAEYSASFRVYAPDLPGEPGKSAPNRPAWDGPGYAEWLEDVLAGLAIQKTALLGISQGGWTALRFATARPERVAKLVLLTPGGVVPTRPGFIARGVLFHAGPVGRGPAQPDRFRTAGHCAGSGGIHECHPDALQGARRTRVSLYG